MDAADSPCFVVGRARADGVRQHAHATVSTGASASPNRLRLPRVQQLAAREERSQIVGLAVAIDDKVVAIDRLATPELNRALEA